ncbi:histone-fold-containing protein [Flammula alnicola]|nr:histone-fold-containing protein [Flammula alnicola]
MSAPRSEDETQIEMEEAEYKNDETRDVEDQEMKAGDHDADQTVAQAKKDKKEEEKKEPVEFVREPGKSFLPFSRVQKIIKADKEMPIVAKEATFLISLATEEFIKRLCEAAQQVAYKEKRSTVQHKDIAMVVRKADEFLFLEVDFSRSPRKTNKNEGRDDRCEIQPYIQTAYHAGSFCSG